MWALREMCFLSFCFAVLHRAYKSWSKGAKQVLWAKEERRFGNETGNRLVAWHKDRAGQKQKTGDVIRKICWSNLFFLRDISALLVFLNVVIPEFAHHSNHWLMSCRHAQYLRLREAEILAEMKAASERNLTRISLAERQVDLQVESLKTEIERLVYAHF